MKFIVMTNPGIDNNVVSELLDSKLIPAIIVTDDPFYCENKNILKYTLKKILNKIKYIRNRNYFERTYQAHFLAKKNSIQTFPSQKVNTDEFAKLIKKNEIDYIFTFTFRILKEKIFTAPKYGCINFHPALLPMNRGIAPSNWSIYKNQKKTGITFHYIAKGIDTGSIIEQYEFSLSGFETAKILNKFLLSIGAMLLVKLIIRLDYGYKHELITNNISEGSYEPRFKKEFRILSEENSFQEIDSTIRASKSANANAVYELSTIKYNISTCIDLTSIQVESFDLPFLDSKNNIIMKTKDERVVLLVTNVNQ